MNYIKSKYNQLSFLYKNLNKIESIILYIWIFFWFGLGTHLYGTFNLNNYIEFHFDFFRANLIFYIFLFLFLFFLYKREITSYLIFSLYPIIIIFNYFINLKTDFYFYLHHSISLLSVILFINTISNKKVNKKIVFDLLHYSTFFILTIFFFILVFPHFLNAIMNLKISTRGEYLVHVVLFDFITLHIPQNSNGASRIVLILLLFATCYYNFLLQKKYNFKNILLLISIVLLSFINLFYQSKFNTLAFFLACCFIFLFNKNHNYKLRIFSCILIIIVPLLSHFYYSSWVNKNYNFYSFNRYLNFSGTHLLFDTNKTNINLISNNTNNFNPGEVCKTHNTRLDKYSSGRICGWEILIRYYFKNFKFYGYGLFEDRKILKVYQKVSSNSYVFALFNGGILSFLAMISFASIILFKIIKIFIIYKKNNLLSKTKNNFYIILTFYLLLRFLLEDTLAFLSIDMLLLVTCVSFLNYSLDISKNLLRR